MVVLRLLMSSDAVEVCNIIMNLRGNIFYRMDVVLCNILKEVAGFIAAPRVYLIDQSFRQGGFPFALRL